MSTVHELLEKLLSVLAPEGPDLSNLCVIGIDPGLTGAIAIVNGNRQAVAYDMPTIHEPPRKRHEVDRMNLEHIMGAMMEYGPHAFVIERAQAAPGQSASSMFNYGNAYGTVVSMCWCTKLPVVSITPADWKRELGLPGGKANKELSRLKALEIFNDEESSQYFRLKKDHNKAEAALIGWAVMQRVRKSFEAALRTPPETHDEGELHTQH